MGQKRSLGAQLVTQIVDRAKTIRALTVAGDVVPFAVTPAEFHENTVRFLSEGKAQIEATFPRAGTGLQFLTGVAMKSWRRRHATEECVDHHGRCSFRLEKSGEPSKFPTIKSKFSRMRKTGVKNP